MEAGISAVENGVRDMIESTVTASVNTKLTGLAKMIRADNRVIAEKLQASTDSDASKRSLRAMKEFQARVPAEIAEAVDERFDRLSDQLHRETQLMAESVAKTSDVLGARVDRAAAEMKERFEGDLRRIIECEAALGPPRPPQEKWRAEERYSGLRLSEYAESARRFVWNDVADWYVETAITSARAITASDAARCRRHRPTPRTANPRHTAPTANTLL